MIKTFTRRLVENRELSDIDPMMPPGRVEVYEAMYEEICELRARVQHLESALGAIGQYNDDVSAAAKAEQARAALQGANHEPT